VLSFEVYAFLKYALICISSVRVVVKVVAFTIQIVRLSQIKFLDKLIVGRDVIFN